MGTTAAAGSSASAATTRHLVEELEALGLVEARRMFGGHGLFCESVMFALVDRQGGAFLRADDGAQKFRERGGHQHPGMPYWSVPASVVDDHDELVRWASDALAVARSHQRKR